MLYYQQNSEFSSFELVDCFLQVSNRLVLHFLFNDFSIDKNRDINDQICFKLFKVLLIVC